MRYGMRAYPTATHITVKQSRQLGGKHSKHICACSGADAGLPKKRGKETAVQNKSHHSRHERSARECIEERTTLRSRNRRHKAGCERSRRFLRALLVPQTDRSVNHRKRKTAGWNFLPFPKDVYVRLLRLLTRSVPQAPRMAPRGTHREPPRRF